MTNGLEDVVAAETILSDVRGAEGQLIIRGYPLVALAGRWTFEQTAHLLFTGFFDDLPDAAEFAAKLGAARVDVFEKTRALLGPMSKLPAYEGMRAAMAMLPDGTALPDALRLLAAPAVLLPALIRLQAGDEPIEPSIDAGHRRLLGHMPRM